jgi:hypothetical protein
MPSWTGWTIILVVAQSHQPALKLRPRAMNKQAIWVHNTPHAEQCRITEPFMCALNFKLLIWSHIATTGMTLELLLPEQI